MFNPLSQIRHTYKVGNSRHEKIMSYLRNTELKSDLHLLGSSDSDLKIQAREIVKSNIKNEFDKFNLSYQLNEYIKNKSSVQIPKFNQFDLQEEARYFAHLIKPSLINNFIPTLPDFDINHIRRRLRAKRLELIALYEYALNDPNSPISGKITQKIRSENIEKTNFWLKNHRLIIEENNEKKVFDLTDMEQKKYKTLSEFYGFAKGIEKLADEEGRDWAQITMTPLPKMQRRCKKWDNKTTIHEANNYLSIHSKKSRDYLAKIGIIMAGITTREAMDSHIPHAHTVSSFSYWGAAELEFNQIIKNSLIFNMQIDEVTISRISTTMRTRTTNQYLKDNYNQSMTKKDLVNIKSSLAFKMTIEMLCALKININDRIKNISTNDILQEEVDFLLNYLNKKKKSNNYLIKNFTEDMYLSVKKEFIQEIGRNLIRRVYENYFLDLKRDNRTGRLIKDVGVKIQFDKKALSYAMKTFRFKAMEDKAKKENIAHDAWSSAHRLRTRQMFGIASRAPWREMHKQRNKVSDLKTEAIRQYALNNNHAKYLKVMGGLNVDRKLSEFKAVYNKLPSKYRKSPNLNRSILTGVMRQVSDKIYNADTGRIDHIVIPVFFTQTKSNNCYIVSKEMAEMYTHESSVDEKECMKSGLLGVSGAVIPNLPSVMLKIIDYDYKKFKDGEYYQLKPPENLQFLN